MASVLPVFLAEPARCHVKSGAVFFCWDGFEIALPINVCRANVAACNRAIAEWERRSAKVIKLRDHAAS